MLVGEVVWARAMSCSLEGRGRRGLVVERVGSGHCRTIRLIR